MSDSYDLMVIGAGMAGSAAATKCANAGWRVAIVDDLPYGGTCALRGCDPKKILRRGAEIIDAARLLRGKGIEDRDLVINWQDLMAHKRGFTDPFSGNMERGLQKAGVTTLHGPASFTGPNSLDIDGESYESSHFLIATGARPRPLNFDGSDHVIDSTAFLELEDLPRRILFIGGGFISFEFAHIAARAGSSIVIVDHGPQPLKGFDPDLVAGLITRGEPLSIKVRTNAEVTGIEKVSSGYRVELNDDSLEVDLIVHGAGREPDLARLNLAAANVDWDRHGVAVADHLQSISNPTVFAAGDAANTPGAPLTPVATVEGKVAASNLLKSSTIVPDYTATPSVVFTIPEIARVGLLEQEARDRGLDVDVRFRDTSGWYSNYRVGETAATSKIIVDRATDQVVGAHLLGPDAAELINLLALGIKVGLTIRQLKSMPTAYPTVGSDLGSML